MMVDPENYDDVERYLTDLRFYDKNEFEFIEEYVPKLEGALEVLKKESVVSPSTRGVYQVVNRNGNASFANFDEINYIVQTYLEPFTGLKVRTQRSDAEFDLVNYTEDDFLYLKKNIERIEESDAWGPQPVEEGFEDQDEERDNHRIQDFNGHGIS